MRRKKSQNQNLHDLKQQNSIVSNSGHSKFEIQSLSGAGSCSEGSEGGTCITLPSLSSLLATLGLYHLGWQVHPSNLCRRLHMTVFSMSVSAYKDTSHIGLRVPLNGLGKTLKSSKQNNKIKMTIVSTLFYYI